MLRTLQLVLHQAEEVASVEYDVNDAEDSESLAKIVMEDSQEFNTSQSRSEVGLSERKQLESTNEPRQIESELSGRTAGVQIEKKSKRSNKRESDKALNYAVTKLDERSSRTITGQVTSTEDGSGLPGVNVVGKGYNTRSSY